MTISSNAAPKAGPFNGNGVQTVFPFTFHAFAKADLLVVMAVTVTGVETTLVLDSNYSVTLNADQSANPGGTVTYPISGTPLPVGSTLTIVSDIEYTQITDLLNMGGFYPDVIEDSLDRGVMQSKQVLEIVSRTLQVAVSTPANVSVTLPAPSASQLIGWNGTATGLVNYVPDVSSAAGLQIRLADTASASNGPGLVGYNAALLYAANTVGFKLKEVRSICDAPFNCRPDGNVTTGAGTNWATQVQAAIDAAVAAGERSLFVPPGVYKLSAQVNVPSQFTLSGAGNYVSIFFAPTAFNTSTGLVRCNGTGGPPTVIENLGILGQNGGAGAASCGLNIAANGTFARNLWVAGFKTNVILGQSDNFLLGCAVEESLSGGTGVSVTSSDVTIADCVFYHNYVDCTVNGVTYLDGTVSISNCRAIASTFQGFVVSNASNVQISNCSVGHNNAGAYTDSGFFVDTGSNVTISNCIARLGSTSTTGVGFKVNASSKVGIHNSQASGFLDGVQAATCSDIAISNNQCSNNGRRGIYATAGDQVLINGNICRNNGTAGVTDAGIYSDNSAGFSLHNITNNLCTQNAGGVQDYGIFANLTDNGGSTGSTHLAGNKCLSNNVGQITLSGRADLITAGANSPDPFKVSPAYNPPNLADGAGVTVPLGLTGAALGDFVLCTFSLDLQGITLTGWVSAANAVSVRFQNETGGAIDLGNGVLSATVIHS